MSWSRRLLALTAALLLPGLPATVHAESVTSRCGPPREPITSFGPASVTNALGNAEFVGDTFYTVTRGLSPNVVGAYDVAADEVTAHHDIPTGIGAWAMTKVGTDIYVGTHIPSDLYKLDTLSGQVTKVASFEDHFIWNITASPDGKVYLGMSETGRVVEYDPATSGTRDLGAAVPGEQYVRSIAADATTVYAGVGSHAHLVAIDRATGAKREISPPELASRDFVASMTMNDTHLAMGISSQGELLVLNKADPGDYRIAAAPGEKYVTAVAFLGEYVYFTGRPTGTLYRYHLETGAVEALGVPYPEAGTQVLHAHDGKIWGTQDGAVFVYDPATGELEHRNLVARGMRAGPEQPMTVFSDGSYVYVLGKGGMQVHREGVSHRIGMPGEPKSMVQVDGRLYLGVYTQALLYGHDPGTGEATRLAGIGNRQDRPRDMAYDADTGLIVIGTQPEPGQANGALSLYDPGTGELDVRRPVVPDQSVYSVAAADGTAYVGTYIQEGFGLPPKTSTARLAAYDLRERELLWQIEPVPGATYIADVVRHRGRLYGVTDTGVLFEVDPVRRQVTRTAKVGGFGGDLAIQGGRLYGISGEVVSRGDRVYRMDLRTFTARTLADGLAGDWFDGAKLAAEPGGCGLYTLRGRDLVRIDTRLAPPTDTTRN
ncbi:PQQ-binding-like beta-propeller repeat protein [Nonomuraea sp. LPB2021202275-12-8]|uniref:PQQ-binding-like beta-propeller repeat protein n=1 Tax=Nonomuraea sp. LPB2021202275-12-8 TaxID=3120159 RepID=UPI00300CF61C